MNHLVSITDITVQQESKYTGATAKRQVAVLEQTPQKM